MNVKKKELPPGVYYKGFKYRLYPTKEQAVSINKTLGCTRLIYNLYVDHFERARKNYAEGRITMIHYPEVTEFYKEYPFLTDIDKLAFSNAKISYETAYKKYKDGTSGKPRYKKKNTYDDSYTTNNQKGSIRIEGSKIRLPKIGFVKFKKHREIQGEIKSVTVSKNPAGQYYVSVLCETVIKPVNKTGRSIGIDLGIKDFAILSDGTLYSNKKFLKSEEKALKRLDRKMSRQKENAVRSGKKLSESKNYQKTKLKRAKLHLKISNRRLDYLHKISSEIIKNHDVIVLESLNVKGMIKNRKLSHAISDAGWSLFVRMIEYKALWYGKKVIRVNTFFPSSKLCHSCGYKKTDLTLSDRSWICPVCSTFHDRDINAAINILNKGLEKIS